MNLVKNSAPPSLEQIRTCRRWQRPLKLLALKRHPSREKRIAAKRWFTGAILHVMASVLWGLLTPHPHYGKIYHCAQKGFGKSCHKWFASKQGATGCVVLSLDTLITRTLQLKNMSHRQKAGLLSSTPERFLALKPRVFNEEQQQIPADNQAPALLPDVPERKSPRKSRAKRSTVVCRGSRVRKPKVFLKWTREKIDSSTSFPSAENRPHYCHHQYNSLHIAVQPATTMDDLQLSRFIWTPKILAPKRS